MRVTLDQEQWEVGAGVTLGEVLADVSDRANKRSRIVTALAVDQRPITDRDLDATLLAQPTARFTHLTASSQSMHDIMQSARPSLQRYANEVRTEGSALIEAFRIGRQQIDRLDLWLGKLADYIELMESAAREPAEVVPGRTLIPWVQELLEARDVRDTVRIADLLEYEVLPRLEC
jgi:hypothetical protein